MVGRIPLAEKAGPIKKRIDQTERAVNDLSRIDGSQYLRIYEKMQALFAGLRDTVTTLVREIVPTVTYTKAQVDSKVSSPGDISPGKVSASGNITSVGEVRGQTLVSGGPATVGGDLNANASLVVRGQVRAPGARNNPIANFRTVVWSDDGYQGYSSSARETKRNISPAHMSEEEFLSIWPVWFQMAHDVDENAWDARWHFGFIADAFVDAGYPHFAFFDPETGDVEGLNYDRLTAPLWDRLASEILTRRQMQKELAEQSERIAALERHLNIPLPEQGE